MLIRTLSVLAASAFAAMLAACASAPAPTAASLEACAQMKDLDRAITGCGEAIDAGSKDAQVYVNRGFAYFIRNDYPRALADLEQAVRLDPTMADAFGRRGIILRATGDDDRAIADFTRALELGSRDTRVLVDRGTAYFVKGDAAKAIADYDAAIARDGDKTFVGELAHLSRGIVYLYGGAPEKALVDFRRAIELDPKHVHAWIWLHLAQKRLGVASDLAAAAVSFDKARWPAPVVRMLLGEETAEAVVAASAGTASACEADFYAAEFMFVQGDRDEAVRLYRAAGRDCRRIHLERVTAAAALRALGVVP